VTDEEFAGFNPRTFEAVTQTVDKGLTIDGRRIGDVIGTILDGGRLAVPRIDTTFTINGGHVRLGNTIAKGRGADLTLAGSANLADATIDARVTLAGPPGEDVTVRPEVYVGLRGPAAAPKRSVDVAALSGWLMLRSIERQAKQLEAIEAERRGEAIGSVPPAALVAPSDAEPKEKPRPVIRTPRAVTAPPAAPPTAPLAVERAPALPPPLEIGPAPGRRPRAAAPDGSQSAPRPPGFMPPAVYGRPLPFDPLVNPQR
jgi:large subunit ribosomal protein L24